MVKREIDSREESDASASDGDSDYDLPQHDGRDRGGGSCGLSDTRPTQRTMYVRMNTLRDVTLRFVLL